MWPFSPRKPKETRTRDKPDWSSFWPVTRTRGDYTLTTSEAIYAAVSRISNTIAAMPIHLYKGFELQRDHPLERLVAYAPNATMTPFLFRQTMEACRNSEGNAYALIVPTEDGMGIDSLDVLDPRRVTPKRDRDTREMWYELNAEDGKIFTIHNSSMLVMRHMAANGEKGIRPVDVLRGTLDYDRDMKDFSAKQLQGVNGGIALKIPSSLSGEKRTEYIRLFLENYRASGGSLVILDGGAEMTSFARSPVDAKVLDVERITKNRVATVYNIPAHMLGDYSDTNNATAEQTMREFMNMTNLPIVEMWENEHDRKLLSWDLVRQGYHFRFSMDNLLRADTETMAKKHQMAIRGGWMRINEVRAVDNQPPDPNGDELMCSRDLIPLREALKGTASQPKGG